MAKTHHPLVAPCAKRVSNKSVNLRVMLHGALRAYGKEFRLDAGDAVQALTGIAACNPGFAATLRRGRYHLIKGRLQNGVALRGAELLHPLADNTRLHLVPAIGGAARGRGKALLGLTLLGLSFIPGANAAFGSAIGGFGQSVFGSAGAAAFGQFGNQLLGRAGTLLLISGGLESLTPQATSPAGILPSSAIATPETSGQGAAIPLVYGTARVTAPVVISSGLDVETH